MYKQILDQAKQNLEAALSYLKEELATLRGGRAQSSLVEDIEVPCYGATYKLKEVSLINIPSPNLVVIQPWDKSILNDISRAISSSSLAITPTVDRESVRLHIPPLSEERRKELSKIVGEKLESVRISMRGHRNEAWDKIQDMQKRGEITEDDKFRAKDELQEMVDGYSKKAQDMVEARKKELMSV